MLYSSYFIAWFSSISKVGVDLDLDNPRYKYYQSMVSLGKLYLNIKWLYMQPLCDKLCFSLKSNWEMLYLLYPNLEIINKLVRLAAFVKGLVELDGNLHCVLRRFWWTSIEVCFQFVLCSAQDTPIHGLNKEEYP